MSDSVNPRMHSKPGNVYVNPHTVGYESGGENSEESEHQKQV